MVTTPAVSVLLPVYNGDKYLAESIDSILGQTFSDFELLVLDDGSTDSTLSILQGYQQQDSRIKVVSRENRGLTATLNELVGMSRGAWVARMDCDDIALPLRLERQIDWLKKTDTDICGTWARYFGSAERGGVKHPQSDEAVKVALLFGSPFVHPSVMMRTSIVRELRYDDRWERAEDYDLWERAARAGYRMGNVPEVLMLYRKHPDQVSSHSSRRQLELTQEIQKRYWRFWAELHALEIDADGVEEMLKIRRLPFTVPCLARVDPVFRKLLQIAQGEAREMALDHVTRLCYRVAGDCPDAVALWSRLHREFGVGSAVGTRLRLWLLRLLRIRANSRMFHYLKRSYFCLPRLS